MEKELSGLIGHIYHCGTGRITPLGGGFYGRAFLAELPVEPRRLVLKAYLFPHLAQKEAAQLEALAQYATVQMPRVYWVHCPGDGGHDVLAMEYIPGAIAGNVRAFAAQEKEQIAREMVGNLLAYHGAAHGAGFGELDAPSFYHDWRDFYRPIAEGTLEKAKALCARGHAGPVVRAVDAALENYDRVFYLPITQARLIHGDYNTWNVILTADGAHVRAVIDPFHCCWGDPEFDLYQLDNANGKQLGLLNGYQKRKKPSENFEMKRCFYALFTEVNHFYDAHVGIENSQIPAQADALVQSMKKYGII